MYHPRVARRDKMGELLRNEAALKAAAEKTIVAQILLGKGDHPHTKVTLYEDRYQLWEVKNKSRHGGVEVVLVLPDI
jgi:hypothetical protein